jgi:hypothetical protein
LRLCDRPGKDLLRHLCGSHFRILIERFILNAIR